MDSIVNDMVHNFDWAVKQMKEGKKVKRRDSSNIHYIDEIEHIVWDTEHKVKRYIMCLSDIESIDWELYEEDNWNLANTKKYLGTGSYGDDVIFKLKNIKTFIQKVKEDLRKKYNDQDFYNDIEVPIDNRAGDLNSGGK